MDQFSFSVVGSVQLFFSLEIVSGAHIARACSRRTRTDCGHEGMNKEECEELGCCWNDSYIQGPFCYINYEGNYTKSRQCNFSNAKERSDCGHNGITQFECEAKNCCYDERVAGANNCFHSGKRNGVPFTSGKLILGNWKTASDVDCYFAYCQFSAYGALGDLTVDHEEDGTVSTFGVKAESYVNSLGVGASVDAHVVHMTKEDEWKEVEHNIGKVGVEAFAGAGGLGLDVGATVAELGGKVGKGAFGIGGKLGVSFDTGVGLGTNTHVKILGTGFKVTGEHGLELCLVGSCLYIG